MGGSRPSDRSNPVPGSHHRNSPAADANRDGGPLPFGIVVKPHGLKGWLKVKPFRPDTSGITEVAAVTMRTADGDHLLKVRSARPDRLGYLLLLEGCHDRESAEKWRGAEVALPREELETLESDEFYLADLTGLRAVDPEGVDIGVITAIGGTPAHDLLTVRNRRREKLVPVVDRFILDVDFKRGEIVLDLPDGLPETEVADLDPDPEP